jgi:hypothetical protein
MAPTTPMSDDFPVLLGPVRLETRFTETELLIRVFPDEWATEKFEPRPTAAEIAALDAYWIALWRSGGDPVAEQAAWRQLTGRIPAGRASWLLQTRLPGTPADRPTGTVVLVIVSAEPLPAADRQPAIDYWTAVWRAHGDADRIRAADATLRTTVGGARARQIRSRRPAGIDEAPAAAGDEVTVGFLVLPPVPAGQIAAQSWSRAAHARLLPDRFTVLGYSGGQQVLSATGAQVPDTLAVSPDPGADSADQLRIDEETGTLHVPDELRWLTDFDRAVAVGMGLRIPLTDQLRGGLDRLLVLGLRADETPQQGAAALADLITRQLRSPDGYGLLPQGTPTNNTEARPAGQDAGEEADAALRTQVQADVPDADDWTAKTDGQWFAELLGLDPAVLAGMPNADGTDQRDARAAGTALWPATWGSYLRTMLRPLLPEAAVDATRAFFLRHVSGRGPLPLVKIGRQPYGLLPTTAFSRLAWPDSDEAAAHRRKLHAVLGAMAQDWRAATGKVARLGDEGDPHQLLLDILALHPTSAEYHQRYAQSVEDIFNRENLGGGGPAVIPALEGLNQPQPLRALLTRLGAPATDPDLVRRLFVGDQYPLLGPAVDDRPLSETDPIRGYLPDGRNYLHWLAEHALTDLETVRLELGFAGDRPPAALLYLLARHALLLGWEDTARRLAAAAHSPVPSAADPLFVHVKSGTPSESRFRQLYSPDPAITGSPDRLVVDHIPDVLTDPASEQLTAQAEALGLLADLPTARLERVLAEHLDCATYRLDAWRLGLANERLAQLRYDGAQTPRRGIHLGAYGWLENVRPRTGPALDPVELPDELAQVFEPPGAAPLQHDPGNGGYVHAPSPSHATTAAVLRAGYVANGTPDNPGAFAVNLSSERVRVALALLDGLRQGQSLGALLGYRFERGLHDRHGEAELDVFISALRGEFPLRAGRLPGAKPGLGVPVELVEARNVIDGLELVRRVTRVPGAQHYPFGADPAEMPVANAAQLAALGAEVDRLLDAHDALADLAVAEGVHQALAGNPERASATLDAYAKEGVAPAPAVVETPRSGTTLTHRLGLMLTPGLRPGQGAPGFLGSGPRALAEPAVNDWLAEVLPVQQDVAVRVTWTDPVNGVARSSIVTQRDLRLQPIELLWAVRPADEAAMTDLDDRIVGVVLTRDRPRPDAELTIRYTERVPGRVTFFELTQLVAALRSLLTASRPFRPTDLIPAAGAQEVDPADDDAVTLPRERPEAVHEALVSLRDDVADSLDSLTPLFAEPPPPRTEIIERIDELVQGYAELIATAGGFGMVRGGWSELAVWRRRLYADVLAEVARAADRMGRALAEANVLIAAYDALPSGSAGPSAAERFRLLEQIERRLATKTTTPRPNTPQQYRSVITNRRQAFGNRLDALHALAETSEDTVSGLLDEVAEELPLTGFDPAGMSLAPFEDRIVLLARELLDRTLALQAEITARLAAADAALAGHDQAETDPDRVAAVQAALKALLGEDVLAVPEYTLRDSLADDLRSARDDSEDLVEHLVDAGRDFPVDDWLHGIARVREKPRLWEQVTLLSDALRGDGGVLGPGPGFDELPLEPVQFPYRPGDSWLALSFAPGVTLDEDRVLFTAHYATRPSPPRSEACGLLLDEWTEVIPAAQETTGIAMHYDRPDSEPPQALLLVTPPVVTGSWVLDDLVAALHETYDLLQARAVEPSHLDDTAYAHLLPATVLSATRRPITISIDLAVHNLRWKSS